MLLKDLIGVAKIKAINASSMPAYAVLLSFTTKLIKKEGREVM